ncbi:MAG: T9SS type A sorting domain-containing protein [FCB group bacterium]
MKKYILFLIISCVIYYNIFAQNIHEGIDTVYYFKPGTGQNNGQSPEYFPKNIFGLPSKNARYTIPESSPEEICSIGLGGVIIVGFKNFEVIDEPGPDFTIFENAFLNPVTNKIFAEPAKVAVSSDGINFVEFPFDSLTLKGCAGITPTNGDKDTFNPAESGGDSFDLADLNLKNIRYIKITDICQMILDNPKHPFYDPTISGFDLDAVVGLNLKQISSDVYNQSLPIREQFNIKMESNILIVEKIISVINSKIKLYNYLGEEIFSGTFENRIIINTNNIPSGIYFLFISDTQVNFYKKIYIQ